MSILRADSIRDRAGTGAPDFPNGLTGNLTGTASTATLANTATVATNAQGLTGTPNITVGTVSGTDATFSGNLTVQGTTTTIDTAVTSVDTLQVDGNVAIGTDTTYTNNSFTTLSVGGNAKFGLLELKKSDGVAGSWIDCYGDGGNGDLRITTAGTSGNISFLTGGAFTEKVRITSGGTAIFKAGLVEKYKQGTTLAAASNEVALSSGNVHRFTTNATSGAKTVNFTGVHSTLANGESVSFTVILTPNNSGYINAATVDGVAPFAGLKWSGGSAPSAGGASGRDVYTFTIFKDGTATDSYEIFGAVQNYA